MADKVQSLGPLWSYSSRPFGLAPPSIVPARAASTKVATPVEGKRRNIRVFATVFCVLFVVGATLGLGLGLGLKGTTSTTSSSSSSSPSSPAFGPGSVSGAPVTAVGLNCTICGITLRAVQESSCGADLACFGSFVRSLGAAYMTSPALANASVRVIATALVDSATGANLSIPLSAPINSADNLPRRRSLRDDNDNGGDASAGARALSTGCLYLLAQVFVASKSQSIMPPSLESLSRISSSVLSNPSTISALTVALAPVESR